MDSTMLPGAVAPPSAVVPADSGFGTPSLGTPQVPSAVSPIEGAPPIPVGVAPDAPASPSSSAQVDLQALQDQARRYQQIAPEYEQQKQAIDQIRQAMALAAQQAREHEAAQAAQSRIDQAYDFAKNLSVEDGLAYVRRNEDAERASLRQEMQRIRQDGQMQTQAMFERLAAPVYARDLAKQHNLPPHLAERLEGLGDGKLMDAYLPTLLAEHKSHQTLEQKLQTALSQIDQLTRGQQAAVLAANGAHVPSGVGVLPVLPNGQQPEAGSDAHLLSIPGVAEFLGFRTS